MIDTIIQFDKNITSYLAGLLPHNSFFDLFFRFFSLQGLTIGVWIVILGAFFIWEEKKHREFIVHFIAGFGITAFLVNIVLKNIFLRERPVALVQIIGGFCPTDFSFPSGHASGAFAGAVIFSHFDKKRKYLYYGIAVMISYSRLYLLCHYFLDVVIGALIGYLISKAVLKYLSGRMKIQDVQ